MSLAFIFKDNTVIFALNTIVRLAVFHCLEHVLLVLLDVNQGICPLKLNF
ncbi:hypothetical protein OMCYN_01790 [cyanobiont of Ornithocercus magnificus]|nr:hypothetical protein OMCYN_01790 [cyanobiont of Ornithocercus magnificus]